MNLARDGAWKFATTLAGKDPATIDTLIQERDHKVADKATIITNPGMIARLILGIIRIGERGSVAVKIDKLKN